MRSQRIGRSIRLRVVDFLDNGCRWDGASLRNRQTGRRVKAILPVHILGHPVDLDPILAVAAKYSLPVIEDATEGLGARYRGKSLGQPRARRVLQFQREQDHHHRRWRHAGHQQRGLGGARQIPDARRRKMIRSNMCTMPLATIIGLTNVLAAMGCAQMEQLDEFVEAKRQIARRYQESLGSLPGIRLPEEAEWAFSTFWMYTVLIDEKEIRHRLAGASPRTGCAENSDPSAVAANSSIAGS